MVANSPTNPVRNSSKTKVVVIGAGMAGLAATVKLVHNGIKDVVLLEAQDYVGGRCKGKVVGGKKLDMGAMYVHGQVGNPIFELAQRMGWVSEDADDDDEWPNVFYTSNKEKVSLQEIEDLLDFAEENISNVDGKVGQSKADIISGYYKKLLQDHGLSENHCKKELYDAAWSWYCFMDMVNEGVNSLGDISAWALGKYVKCAGNQLTHIKGGYTTVVQALLDIIPEGVVKTEMPVQHIDWNHPNDGRILVHCANGDVITADHVIVTMSLGCLKAVHSSMFFPALPSPFVKSLEKLKQGTIGKIFLKWDQPFWTKQQKYIVFLWLESHPITLAQDKSKRKSCLGKLWWQYIPGFQITAEHQDVLLLWLLQHQIEAIKGLDDQEITAILHELLQVFLHDIDVPMPNALYKTNWEDNPYIRGTYTYPVPSFDSRDMEYTNLPTFPSNKNPRLMFAGEACTVEYMTTTHGGFVTGEQQAEKVLKANGFTNICRVVDTSDKMTG